MCGLKNRKLPNEQADKYRRLIQSRLEKFDAVVQSIAEEHDSYYNDRVTIAVPIIRKVTPIPIKEKLNVSRISRFIAGTP